MKRGAIEHPKMLMLAKCLKVPRLLAVGIMESLWHWAGRYARTGDLSKYDREWIAAGIGYEGDADELFDALIRCRWLDVLHGGRLVIHDWSEHADDATHVFLARSQAVFADGKAPSTKRLSKAERERLGLCAQQAHAVPTASALPEPEPEPEPEPLIHQEPSLGGPYRAGAREVAPHPEGKATEESAETGETVARGTANAGRDGSTAPATAPQPSKDTARKPKARQNASNRVGTERDRSDAPTWCEGEPEVWALACEIADGIEAAETGETVNAAGGNERASRIAMLIQDCGKGSVVGMDREVCIDTLRRLAGGAWQSSDELLAVMQELQRYPDGAYPNTVARKAAGKRPPSRIERAARVLAEMNRGAPAGASPRRKPQPQAATA